MRVPAPSGRRESLPSYGGAGFGGGGKLNIPGVQKGFGQARTVPSQAAGVRPATLFHEGDRVQHRVFGKGTISEVRHQSDGDRLVIEFESGQIKTFPANTAPIVRID